MYSNGSWCGNDTASERSMVRRYLADCCEYWAREYHLDGFRFDIASLLDTETINAVMERVKQVNPHCLFYGEGWKVASDLTKKEAVLAGQETSALTPGFGFFNDTLRDGVRGSLFDDPAGGWLAGEEEFVPQLKDCIRGNAWWCPQPNQAVNFVSCHDNWTLWDKLAQVFPEQTPEFLRAANGLAAAMVFFSQGMPFLLGGEELLLSKADGNGGMTPTAITSPTAETASPGEIWSGRRSGRNGICTAPSLPSGKPIPCCGCAPRSRWIPPSPFWRPRAASWPLPWRIPQWSRANCWWP